MSSEQNVLSSATLSNSSTDIGSLSQDEQSLFKAATISHSTISIGDISQIGQQVNHYQSESDFNKSNLNLSAIPVLPDALEEQVLSIAAKCRYLVVSASPEIDTSLLLQSLLGTLLRQDVDQGNTTNSSVHIWKQRFGNSSFNYRMIPSVDSRAFIIEELSIAELQEIPDFWWKARSSNGYTIISTKSGTEDALLKQKLKDSYWIVNASVFEQDSHFLISDDWESIQNWYLRQCKSESEREQLLSLGLAYLSGLEENQFFSALEELFEQSWKDRYPNLYPFDYSDLSTVGAFVRRSEKLDAGQFRLSLSSPHYRDVVLSTAWIKQRRQILSTLPTLVKLVKRSVTSNRKDLYGSEIRSSELRKSIADSIGNITLLSEGVAEDALLELASDPNVLVQLSAAQSLANWRGLHAHPKYTALKPEEQFFRIIESWYRDSQENSRIKNFVFELLRDGRSVNQESPDLPEDYILSTVALTIGLAAKFDPPNQLSIRIINLFKDLGEKLGKTPRELLMDRFSTVTLPCLVRMHLSQVSPILKDLASNDILVKPIAYSLIQYWYTCPGIVDQVVDQWLEQHCSSEMPERTNCVALAFLVQSERTHHLGYHSSDLTKALSLMFNFITRCTSKSDDFKRLIVSFAISNLVSNNLSVFKETFSDLITRLVQPELSAQIIGQIYIKQRLNYTNGDFSFKLSTNHQNLRDFSVKASPALVELDPSIEWSGVEFQGYSDSNQRQPTEVELWLFEAVQDDSSPQLQSLALRTFSYLYKNFDKFEEEAAKAWQKQQGKSVDTASHDQVIPVSPLHQAPLYLKKFVPWLATINRPEYRASVTNTIDELHRQQQSLTNALGWVFGRLKNSPNRSARLVAPSLERATWLLENTWLILLLGAVTATFAISGIEFGIHRIAQLTSSNQPSESTGSSAISSSTPGTPTLSVDEAKGLIAQWLGAKSKIFAPPYDSALLGSLTAGSLYEKNLRSIEWLRANNAYYTYDAQEIRSIGDYSLSGNQALLVAEVAENRIFHKNGRVIPGEHTQFSVLKIRYTFEFSDGQWKLVSYEILEKTQ
jgi:serine/threonine-protein kinase